MFQNINLKVQLTFLEVEIGREKHGLKLYVTKYYLVKVIE